MSYPNPLMWEAPDYPSTPFAEALIVFDSMRLLVLAMCVFILIQSIGAMFTHGGNLGQKARLIGGALVFFFYVGGTEIEHFGDYANWRLYIGFLTAVAMSWGMWSYYKWERPSELRIDKV
jgi:hypothetical protein